MKKEVFVDKHAFIDVVRVNKNNIKNIYRELHPQSLGDGKYLYWRPTGMGKDEDIQFRMGDYLIRRWDDRIDGYNWFCCSKDEWLAKEEDYIKVGEGEY